MGIACYNKDRDIVKKKSEIENQRRASCKSKSYNDGYNFSPIDENGNDTDGRTDSKKDNVKIQKEQNNGSKSNSKTNKNQNNNVKNRNNSRKKADNKNKKKNTKSNKNNGHNDDENNNNKRDNDDAPANINDKNNDNSNNNNDCVIIKSYLDFNINSVYYISCPNCKKKVPIIKNADYDSYKDDFIVEYFCNCTSNEDDNKSYFINFISDKKPENVTFSFESLDKLKSMLDTVRDKQDDFQGFLILEKIYKNLNNLKKKMSYNKSVAPPANFQKSLVENKNN